MSGLRSGKQEPRATVGLPFVSKQEAWNALVFLACQKPGIDYDVEYVGGTAPWIITVPRD